MQECIEKRHRIVRRLKGILVCMIAPRQFRIIL